MLEWLANFAIFAKVANWLRTGCEVVAKFRLGCEMVAKFPALLICTASHPVSNCISFSSLCLGFSIDFWAC